MTLAKKLLLIIDCKQTYEYKFFFYLFFAFNFLLFEKNIYLFNDTLNYIFY